MEAKSFAYWLQGYFELSEGGIGLSAAQVQIIKNHLHMVFKHDIDPKLGDDEHLSMLNYLHDGLSINGLTADEAKKFDDAAGLWIQSAPVNNKAIFIIDVNHKCSTDILQKLNSTLGVSYIYSADSLNILADKDLLKNLARSPAVTKIKLIAGRPGVKSSGPRYDPHNTKIMC